MKAFEGMAAGNQTAGLNIEEQDIVFLRDQAAWAIAANQDLSERLAVARGERRAVEARANATEHEATVLRRENQMLRAHLAEMEAHVESLKRRHRIMVESLLVDGALLKLGEILLRAGVISSDDLEQALSEQGAVRDRLLGSILVSGGRVSEEDVAQAVACQFSVPMLSIDPDYIDTSVAWRVGERICRDYQCVPIRSAGGRMLVAMTNPASAEAQRILREVSDCAVVPFVATATEIEGVIREAFSRL